MAFREVRVFEVREALRLWLAGEGIAVWVADDLTAVKVSELLERRGVSVPCRTVQRYVAEV